MAEENQGNEALSEQEAADYRASIAGDILGDDEGGTASEEPGTSTEKETKVETKPDKETDEENQPDPWEGVPQVIKDQFQAMEKKVSGFETVTERLKQAESRIGALTNEATKAKQDAEKLAEQDKAAPTQEQIDAAKQSESEWEDLKEEFPVWAKVIDDRFSKENETVKELQKTVETLQKKGGTSEAAAQEIDGLKQMMISIKHPNWQETKNDDAFQTFAGSTDEYKKLRDSRNPLDAIKLLDAYAAKTTETPDKKSGKTSAQIEKERQDRLKKSTTPSTGNAKTRPKSEEDMDDAEFRRREGEKIYSEA